MRTRILQVFFTILFVLSGILLYYLQIVKGPYYRNLSSRNSIRLLNIPAPRGNVYDRDGRLVAGNTLSFGIFIVPQEADDLDGEIDRLARILDVSKSVLERSYKRNRTASFAPCELIRDVSKRSAIAVEEARIDMPGVLVKEIPVRKYFYKEAFSHPVGYVGEIDQLELELLKPYGYNIRDMIGKDGVERCCDRILHGRNGGMQIQIDNRGRQKKVMSFKRPKSGRDLYLTIDARLQKEVWGLMEGYSGAAIFMDPHNGEILSLVSAPSYDPNRSLVNTLRQKGAPLLNRAIMGVYPPGSVFKIVTSIAGLESGKIRPETSFLCTGRFKVGKDEFECWNKDGHGYVDLNKAIAWSCNIYFYNTGILVGAEEIYEYATRFGFGRKTGIELFSEAAGFLPSRQWKRLERKENWYAGDTANLSIGQGDLLATPLQVLCMVASIANRGILVQPHIVRRVGDSNIGNVKTENLKVKEEYIEVIKQGMKGVVKDPDGTGTNAWSSVVSISAKTGTAQVGGGLSPHGWFAGFAPSQNPRICFVVFLEHAGSGGDFPAQIAKQAVEYWFRNNK
jgi:penicillin-binding protein 2